MSAHLQRRARHWLVGLGRQLLRGQLGVLHQLLQLALPGLFVLPVDVRLARLQIPLHRGINSLGSSFLCPLTSLCSAVRSSL